MLVVSLANRRERGWGGRAGTKLPLLAAVWTLSKPAGKLYSYRYLCKDELVITSALGPLSVSPLEYVLPC